MSTWNKIRRFFYNTFYTIPFGMKGANDEIFGISPNEKGNITVEQKVSTNSLADALLKGEVTQEVEELRYKNYLISDKSEEYQHIGDGIAIKKVVKNGILRQENKIIPTGILEELQNVNIRSGKEYYTLNIEYCGISRHKIEKNCQRFEVDFQEKKISFYTQKSDVSSEPQYRMFCNALQTIKSKKRNDITDYPKGVTFITDTTTSNYKSGLFYTLIGLNFEDILETTNDYILIYKFQEYQKKDFTEIFYSKEQDEKYKNKEKKIQIRDINETERVIFCSVCGKEINTHDGDITTNTYGFPLCNDCLKEIQENENSN